MNLDMPEIVSNICIKWQSEAPFFAEFLLRTKFIQEPEIQTIGVGIKNNRVCMYYSKDFLESISKLELEGVLVHEILHLLHKFEERINGRERDIFNIAQDACINDTVVNTTISTRRLAIPEGGVTLKQINEMGYTGDPITEKIYDFLYENAPKYEICSDGSGNGNSDGQGSSKPTLQTTDNHGKQKELGEIEKQAIDEIIKNAKVKSWGSISGNIVGEIKELLKTKKIPWREKLNKMLAKYVSEPGSIYENTWSRRNRRGLPLPGIRKKSKRIIITMDTSGSVSDDDIKKFFGQLEKIIKDYSEIYLIQWDTEIHSAQKYKKGDWRNIKISGRGGTIYQPVIDYIKEHFKNTMAVVNFTDGYFSWNINNYGIDLIWAFVNNTSTAPIGKTVHIIDEE
jgi:predicted metal-dependent peptidase